MKLTNCDHYCCSRTEVDGWGTDTCCVDESVSWWVGGKLEVERCLSKFLPMIVYQYTAALISIKAGKSQPGSIHT